MARSNIPDIVIGRLPIYLRALVRLQAEQREITSSHELGKRLGISSAQIRKDLSHFGEFGKQGTGYHITTLSNALQKILHVDREWRVVLVGFGNLGHAIANYGGFAHRGFHVTHIFDNDPAIVGTQLPSGHTVLPMEKLQETVRKEGIQVAMLTTPADSAQEVADQLIAAGIRAILNYAPIVIYVPEGVQIQYIDPVIHLQRMTYYLDK